MVAVQLAHLGSLVELIDHLGAPTDNHCAFVASVSLLRVDSPAKFDSFRQLNVVKVLHGQARLFCKLTVGVEKLGARIISLHVLFSP